MNQRPQVVIPSACHNPCLFPTVLVLRGKFGSEHDAVALERRRCFKTARRCAPSVETAPEPAAPEDLAAASCTDAVCSVGAETKKRTMEHLTHAVLIERLISRPDLPHLLNARAFVGSWWKVVLILRVPAQGKLWESKGIFRLRRYAER